MCALRSKTMTTLNDIALKVEAAIPLEDRAYLPNYSKTFAHRLIAELDAAGWQLVPKILTPRMEQAAIDRPTGSGIPGVWNAALIVAPKIGEE